MVRRRASGFLYGTYGENASRSSLVIDCKTIEPIWQNHPFDHISSTSRMIFSVSSNSSYCTLIIVSIDPL